MINLSKDYRYSITYRHYGDYSCKESGCDDEGICRCFSITSVEIESVDVKNITDKIFTELYPDENKAQHKRERKLTSLIFDYDIDLINRYCIHRILSINKVWDKDNWTPRWSGGYYGDEVDSIELLDSVYSKILFDIDTMIEMDGIEDKINYVLALEYGYIIDNIKGKSYTSEIVDKEDLVFGQENHLRKVSKNKYDYYSDSHYRDIPRGVAYFDNGKWRVIDGYHRLNETKFPKVNIIGIK